MNLEQKRYAPSGSSCERKPSTRVSHRLPAATADTLAGTALRSVGRLDVLSNTPVAASVARLVAAPSPPFRDGNR
jgi:hypothetical protein